MTGFRRVWAANTLRNPALDGPFPRLGGAQSPGVVAASGKICPMGSLFSDWKASSARP